MPERTYTTWTTAYRACRRYGSRYATVNGRRAALLLLPDGQVKLIDWPMPPELRTEHSIAYAGA